MPAPPPFDWNAFVSNGLSTALGALLGFAFALALAWLQNRRSDEQAAKERHERQTLILKLAVHTCAVNVESLLNFKEQYAIPLAADGQELAGALETGDTEHVVSTISHLRNIVLSVSPLGFLEFAKLEDFAFTTDDAPMLTSFVHQAGSTLGQLNEHIRSRNDLIAENARANGRGMSVQEVQYFSAMLAAQARNILKIVDQAAFFCMLVHDQVFALGKAKYGNGKFRKFEVLEAKRPLLPPLDYLKGYREVLVDKFE